MALTKQTVTDKIEIVGEFSHIQVREATRIIEDGNIISQSYHRYAVSPGETSSDPKVSSVIDTVHTQDVINAYQTHLARQQES